MGVTLKGALGSVVFAAGMLVAAVGGVTFDCNNYNPNICTLDAIMFCLTNGSIITGRCHAQRAVCLENKALDESFSACSKGGVNSKFDCTAYLANPFMCTKDLIPFCLNNATVVHGSCAAKQAVCKESKQVVDDFSTCNQAGMASPNNNNNNSNDGNSASTVTATVSIVFGLLLSWAF